MKEDADFFEVKLVHEEYNDVCANPDYLKRWGLYYFLPEVFLYEEGNAWEQSIRDQGRGFRLIFCHPEDARRVVVELKAADILFALSQITDTHKWNNQLLQMEADYVSLAAHPIQGDSRCLGALFDETTFTYVWGLYNHDESLRDSAFRAEQASKIRQFLSSAYQTIDDDATVHHLERIRDNHVMLRFKYCSSLGDSIIVKFTPEEVGTLLKNRE